LASLAATALVALAALPGCGGDDQAEDPTTRRAEIYAAVITDLAELGDPADERPVVFVGPLSEDVVLDLDLQVAVVEQLDEVAEIRFIDLLEQALADEATFIDEAPALLVGSIPDTGDRVEVPVEWYLTPQQPDASTMTVVQRDGTWQVTTA
jgi:hypothetical protein